MKVGEEDGVLRVDLVCIHRHDGDVVMLALYRPRHVDTPLRPVSSWLGGSPACLLVELEDTLQCARGMRSGPACLEAKFMARRRAKSMNGSAHSTS
jgi:hypothetical protein